ncbi:MAG TPA: serine/threonine-protein kinase [Kofleriaceae bacterium]|nr:serine/threonine-protein kinase [Kofleriaceae bacterium]
MEGQVIGTYKVERKLGEGGMGAVYVAEHTLLGRKAAIKVLLPMLSASQSIVQRFFNEARAVTQIADPGIVQVFDFGYHTDGSAYIVMELLDGETMDARLNRLRRFHPADALRLIRQTAASLAAAHAKGIVQRDLKPENIFIVGDPAVTGGERPKILDFGIAKLSNAEPGKMKTQTGALMGTPVYMSPEQCRGAGDIDHRSDIYSLGCVLFCMLTGRPPFEGEGSGEIIAAHLREPAPAPSTLAPDVPPALDALVLKCLEKSAAARYQTMNELVAGIAQCEAAIAGTVAIAAYPGYPTPPPGSMLGYGTQPPHLTPHHLTPPPPHLTPHHLTPPPPPTPTTLGNAAGATATHVPTGKARLPIYIGAVLGAFGIGAIMFVVFGGGSKNEPAQQPVIATPASIDAAQVVTTPPDAAQVVTAPPDAAQIAASPPDAALPPDAAVHTASGHTGNTGNTHTHHQGDGSNAHHTSGSGSGNASGGSGSGSVDRGD